MTFLCSEVYDLLVFLVTLVDVCSEFQYLHYAAEVAVGSQLQALLLGPGLDVAELLAQDGPPVVRAQPRVGLRDQLVEQPHVDEVEELGEQLDGEGRVDTATPQQRHGPRQRVQHVLCGGEMLRRECAVTLRGGRQEEERVSQNQREGRTMYTPILGLCGLCSSGSSRKAGM